MENIHIQCNSETKEKLMALLTSYTSDELQIIHEVPPITENTLKPNEELNTMEIGTDEYISNAELRILLEKTILKNPI